MVDPVTGKQVSEFAYPQDVAAAIGAFKQDKSRLVQALEFPRGCRDVLNLARMLNPQEAEWVASLMAAVDGDEEIDVEEEMMRAPRVASATVLLLRAPDWMAANVAVEQRAQSIIDAAIAGIPDKLEAPGPRILMAPSHLELPPTSRSSVGSLSPRRKMTKWSCGWLQAAMKKRYGSYSGRRTGIARRLGSDGGGFFISRCSGQVF